MKKFILIVTVLLFFTAITNINTILYIQILKWLVFLGAVWIAYNYFKTNKKISIAFVVIAILFNPIVPVYIQEMLRVICFVTGLFFVPFAFEKYLPVVLKLTQEKNAQEADSDIPAEENNEETQTQTETTSAEENA